jgi:regulator of sigma E protease
MNFVYAFAVFIGVYAFVGIPEPINTNRIVTIHRGSPALQAGVHEGDRLTGVEAAGKTLRSSDVQELKQHIRQSQAPVVTLLLQRSGQELQRTFRPLYEAAPPEDPERDAQGRPLPAMRMKVQFEVQTLYQKVSMAGALRQGWNDVSEMWSGIAGLLFRAATLRLTSDDRGSVGGPVKIAEMVGMYSLLGWAPLLVFSGILSVNLAIMNLLPLPALDGGRILFLGYELVAGRPVDAKKENMVHTGGMVVLLAFMVFITARDVWPLIYNNLP